MSGRRSGSGRGGSSRGSWERGADYGRDDWDDASGSVPQSSRRAGGSRGSGSGARSRSPMGERSDWDDRSHDSQWRDWDDGESSRGGARGAVARETWEPPRGRRGSGERGSSARGRSSRGGIGGGVIALIALAVLAVVGAGAYALITHGNSSAASGPPVADSPFVTPTAGPTPTPPVGFKAFESARGHYGLYYPQVWDASSKEATLAGQSDSIDGFTLANSPSHVTVEQAVAFTTHTNQEIIKAEVSGAQQNGVTINESTTQSVTLVAGGAQWDRREYDVTANGQPLHMVVMATHHGGLGYVIVLVSDAGSFGNDMQAIYTPMLASFHFTS
ncbi:MAG TPA: hypothetical protein VF807_11960 [Ktedonobacterales bacterium]